MSRIVLTSKPVLVAGAAALALLAGSLFVIPAPPSLTPESSTTEATHGSRSVAMSLWDRFGGSSSTPSASERLAMNDPEHQDLAYSAAMKEHDAYLEWVAKQGTPEAQAKADLESQARPHGFLDTLKSKVGLASPRTRESDPPALTTPRAQAGGAAILLGPNGACTDAFGMIYVADTGHSRIQAFYPDGVPGVNWGTKGDKPGEFKTPVDLACGPDGTVYVADMENNRVQAFKPDGTLQTDWGTKGVVALDKGLPFGLAVDSLGILYVADVSTRSIRMIDGAGQQINRVTDDHIKTMTDLYVSNDNQMFVADQEAKAIHVFLEDLYQKSYALPQSPRAITADRDGQLYVALTDGSILSMNPSGSILHTWKPNDQQPWYGPTGLATWKNRLYIVSQSLATVWAFTP